MINPNLFSLCQFADPETNVLNTFIILQDQKVGSGPMSLKITEEKATLGQILQDWWGVNLGNSNLIDLIHFLHQLLVFIDTDPHLRMVEEKMKLRPQTHRLLKVVQNIFFFVNIIVITF